MKRAPAIVALLLGGCGLFQTGAVTQNASPLGVDVRARQCAHLGQVTNEQLHDWTNSPTAQSGFVVQNSNPLLFGSRADQLATLSQRITRHQVLLVRSQPLDAPAPAGATGDHHEQLPTPPPAPPRNP